MIICSRPRASHLALAYALFTGVHCDFRLLEALSLAFCANKSQSLVTHHAGFLSDILMSLYVDSSLLTPIHVTISAPLHMQQQHLISREADVKRNNLAFSGIIKFILLIELRPASGASVPSSLMSAQIPVPAGRVRGRLVEKVSWRASLPRTRVDRCFIARGEDAGQWVDGTSTPRRWQISFRSGTRGMVACTRPGLA